MRLLVSGLINLVLLLLAVLSVPARLLRSGRRAPYVRFRLKGDPPYRTPLRRRSSLFRRPEPATVVSLEALRRELEILSRDPVVKGVVFEVEELTAPGSKRRALSDLLEIPRKAGKEVIAFAVTATTSEYALLCCADRIVMPAAGRLELTGFSAEATALGSGLKQVGVAAHFIRRGDYKTAPELFTHDVISKIQRETLETFLDERYAELIELMAKGRKMSPEEARRKVDAGPYSARRAAAERLVDTLCSEAELEELLTGKRDEGSDQPSRLATFPAYASRLPFPPVRWRPFRALPRLGLVMVDGIIADGEGGSGLSGMRVAGSESVVKALRAARRSQRCDAVLLYVDSPGGTSTAAEKILEEVKRLAKKKKVLAYFDRVAASGGYMVALGAHEMWAGAHAIVGSIGVFAGKFDFSGLLDRVGVHRELITRGANAGIHSPSRPFTSSEREALEIEIEETYQAFLEHVAAARDLSKEDVHRRAEGRVFSGTVALAQELVDGTCDFEAACRRAFELTGKTPERFQMVPFTTTKRRFSLLSALAQTARAQVWALMWPWIEAAR